MSFYDEMREVADDLLGPSSEFAQGVLLLRRLTPGTGPVLNPGDPTPTDYPLSGTVAGVGKEHVDGTLILASDLVATVAVPAVEPRMSDKVLVDGREHSIRRINRIPKAGTAVAFELFIGAA